MDCLGCGADIGSSIGMCEACKSARDAEPRFSGQTPKAESIGSSLYHLIFDNPGIICVIILLPLAVYMHARLVADETILVATSGGRVILESPEQGSRIIYNIGGSEQLNVRVLQYDVQQFSFSKGAFRGFLAYLTEAEYEQMQEIRGCKSGFLNSTAKKMLVVPKNQDSIAYLKNLSLQQGDRIRLTVTDLTAASLKLEKRELPPNAWFPGIRIAAIDRVDKIMPRSARSTD